MTNWKEIHEDFTKELQKEWENKWFSYWGCKGWINTGLQPTDVDYADWLKSVKYECIYYNQEAIAKYQEWIAENGNDQELRTEYQKYKEWVNINKGFAGYWGNVYQNGWKNISFTPLAAQPWVELGLELSDYELVAYSKWKDYDREQINLIKLEREYKEWKRTPKPAQEYLDIIYPKKQREEITKLNISDKKLVGKLDLNDFINLEKFDCSLNQLNNLDLTNCEKLEELSCLYNQLANLSLPPNLTKLNCENNQLTNLDFSTLNPEKLTELDINDNNFFQTSLSIFSLFANLELLYIGNGGWKVKERLEQNIYNRFYGSLEPLKSLTKLQKLDISNTDINSGWEHLPVSIEKISFSSEARPSSKVKRIAEQLKWIGESFSGQQLKKWVDFGFLNHDYDFIAHLTKQGYQPQTSLNYENLRKEYNKGQGWLDQKYSKEERNKIKSLDINDKNLESDLDLSDFVKLEKLNCQDNKLTSLNVSNCSRLIYLNCCNNLLTNITLPNKPTSLRVLFLGNNSFGSSLGIQNKPQDNSLFRDLSFLTRVINLEGLHLGNNKFTGSLDYLNDMNKLTELNISDTDLNKVDLKQLTNNLREIRYSTEERPDCKLTKIVPQLDEWTWKDIHSKFTLEERKDWEKEGFDKEKTEEWIKVGIEPKDYSFASYLRDVKKLTPNTEVFLNNKDSEEYWEMKEKLNKYGWCQKCQQVNTSKRWCQLCSEKDWEKLTGQELINKFIQQQRLREVYDYDKYNLLQWMPYKKFGDIEYLAEGGFSKVYKAIWGNRDVVLKSINNSWNITLDFLKEVTNNKLVDNSGSVIIKCLGISQDPETKNYLMVMDYVEGGNLRQYLQQKSKGLNFKDRLEKLRIIANGLRIIHDERLVHCDFHVGNILSDDKRIYITDLGLSKLVDSQLERGKIYGVLPYVAPEVLKGKPYTQASDIYSFGIVAYEWLTNAYPYPKMDDMELALAVCRGYRPNIDKVPIPQPLRNLIKSCWDDTPEQRPNSWNLYEVICIWHDEVVFKKGTTLFYQQYQDIEQKYNTFSQKTPYQIHPKTVTTSKMIDTKKINELLEDSKQNNIPKSIEFSLTELQKALEEQNGQETKKQNEAIGMENNSQFSQSIEFNTTELNQVNWEEIIEGITNWVNIHSFFTPELVSRWVNHNFTYSQTQEWINVGLTPDDTDFTAWLRDDVKLTPEKDLNKSDITELRELFQEYKKQLEIETQIEQPPK